VIALEAAVPLLVALSVVFVPLVLAWWLVARSPCRRPAEGGDAPHRLCASPADPCCSGACPAPFCTAAPAAALHCRRCPLSAPHARAHGSPDLA